MTHEIIRIWIEKSYIIPGRFERHQIAREKWILNEWNMSEIAQPCSQQVAKLRANNSIFYSDNNLIKTSLDLSWIRIGFVNNKDFKFFPNIFTDSSSAHFLFSDFNFLLK